METVTRDRTAMKTDILTAKMLPDATETSACLILPGSAPIAVPKGSRSPKARFTDLTDPGDNKKRQPAHCRPPLFFGTVLVQLLSSRLAISANLLPGYSLRILW